MPPAFTSKAIQKPGEAFAAAGQALVRELMTWPQGFFRTTGFRGNLSVALRNLEAMQTPILDIKHPNEAKSAFRTGKIASMMCRLRKTNHLVIIWFEFHCLFCFQLWLDTYLDQIMKKQKMCVANLGWYDLLERLARVHRCKTTACRALHRLVETAGVTFPLKFDVVQIVVKKRKPHVHQVACYPNENLGGLW